MFMPPEQVHRILIVNIAHIGDIVLSCPIARTLKCFYPNAKIDMLVSMPQGEAAYHNPYISDVLLYDIQDWQKERAKLLTLIHTLRRKRYELALSSRYGSLDAMLAWLSGAVYRIGFDKQGSRKFLTHPVPYTSSTIRHETEYQLEVLSPLGITTEDTSIEFSVSAEEESCLCQKLQHLQKKQHSVVICPYSDYSKKNWTTDGFISVVKRLTNLANCFLVGSYRQLPALNAINAGAGNMATVFGGTLSLGELGALIRKSNLFITVDTGPLHIAQAFKTPVIALMGPTDPRVWGPRRPFDIALTKSMDCSFCWHKDEALSNSCQSNECMRRIQPTEVIQSAVSILAHAMVT